MRGNIRFNQDEVFMIILICFFFPMLSKLFHENLNSVSHSNSFRAGGRELLALPYSICLV